MKLYSRAAMLTSSITTKKRWLASFNIKHDTKNSLRTIAATLCLNLSPFSSAAVTADFEAATTAITVQESMSATKQDTNESSVLKMVGQADMDLLWFSIYSAKLMSVDGEYQQDQFPLKLEIEYHRDIDAEDLIEATVDQWQHIGIDSEEIVRLQQQIEQAWPDVKEGDRLSFMMHSQDRGQFYFNEQALPIIQEPGFAAAFLDIWLSEQTSRPELRQQLIGANK
ncbi:chalcone isomerase family protein [Shewanella japonica]|uniref:chalcone isomerase family protein n=1 Tax=Shewanella japonica TaxID=93973 RepID=UPI002494DB86|nr:chalcone isomerase family protein [Shewanella japonica]